MGLSNDYLYLAHRQDNSMARRFCPRLAGRVLDIGCGRQPFRRFLSRDTEYIGLEVNPELPADVFGDVCALPIASSSIDAAMCNEVLEHVADPLQALKEIHRVVRPGGFVFITVPQMWGLHYEPYDFFRYTNHGIAHLARSAGFDLVEVRRMGGLFSFFAVRCLDLFVTRGWFRLCDSLGLQRGRYRLAALLLLPLTAILIPVTSALDRLDNVNPYGWAVLLRRPT
jgi:SAM-dependent methyltransferase